jgi:hypothetical protein
LKKKEETRRYVKLVARCWEHAEGGIYRVQSGTLEEPV